MPSVSNETSNEQPNSRPRFVFDADFPRGIIQQLLKDWTLPLHLLSPLEIIPTVQGVSDEDFIVNAWQKKCQGVVTCNHYMLDVPETLAIIRQTKMTVVACHGKTNKVQFATGVLLINLENIAKNYQTNQPQLWELRQRRSPPLKFGQKVRTVERNCKCSLKDYERSKVDLETPLFP